MLSSRASSSLLVVSTLLLVNCGTSGNHGAGASGGTDGGGPRNGDASSAGGAGAGTGGVDGAGGGGLAGSTGTGGTGGNPYSNPDGGVITCMPGVAGTGITACGYPYSSGTPLTGTVFNEVEVLRAIQPAGAIPMAIVRLFYNDEHALTLGVRNVTVKDTSGTTSTDYPVSPLTTNPGSVTSAQFGTNELAGDQSGLDTSLRPMWPVLFLTDITASPSDTSGDWQKGGVPHTPTAVFGTWKAAVRSVDKTVSPNKITITPDADPTKNNWNLGTGADPVPSGLANEGYGAEVRWDVPLASGHSYRIQVMVHDGDQNKGGGDSGEACVIYCAGGGGDEGGGGQGGAGGGPPPPMCPTGSSACGPGGIDPSACPTGTACANGCCLTIIP
jgi:hypothetical protein